MKSLSLIPAMLEKKIAFLESAFDDLAELEARLANNQCHLPVFISVVNFLDAYPTGICPVAGGKTLLYCADALVSASLGVLWKDGLASSDAEHVGSLLEDALGYLLEVKALCEAKGGAAVCQL